MWIVNILKNLNISDWILIATLIAIVWYSWETRQLRKWQKKQVQLMILTLDMQRVKNHADNPKINVTPYAKPFPEIVRKIYELGEFDAKDLYAYKQPLSFCGKLWGKAKSTLNK